MDVILDVTKNVEENASIYFEKAKKAKKKLEGVKKALDQEINIQQKSFSRKKTQKKEWYEKFHWCLSSKNNLIIGGRDATTNELVIKKHSQKEDLAFHTDMKGSPFVILKQGINAKKTEKLEAATMCACHSQAWKQNMPLEVFYVGPEQLSKQANPGEANPQKGGFIVRGKTTYLSPELKYAIGIHEEKVMGGAESAIKKHCKKYAIIIPGNNKSSDVAKQLCKNLDHDDLDSFIRTIPAGGCKVHKYF